MGTSKNGKKYFFQRNKEQNNKTKKVLQIPQDTYWTTDFQKDSNETQKRLEEKSRKLKSVKLSDPPHWSDVYELPFKHLGAGRIYDANSTFMFQIETRLKDSGYEKLLEVFNGEKKVKEKINCKVVDEIMIQCDAFVVKATDERQFADFILIRGWGGLTGNGYGGRALNSDKASQIQNSLRDYLIERITDYDTTSDN